MLFTNSHDAEANMVECAGLQVSRHVVVLMRPLLNVWDCSARAVHMVLMLLMLSVQDCQCGGSDKAHLPDTAA